MKSHRFTLDAFLLEGKGAEEGVEVDDKIVLVSADVTDRFEQQGAVQKIRDLQLMDRVLGNVKITRGERGAELYVRGGGVGGREGGK